MGDGYLSGWQGEGRRRGRGRDKIVGEVARQRMDGGMMRRGGEWDMLVGESGKRIGRERGKKSLGWTEICEMICGMLEAVVDI